MATFAGAMLAKYEALLEAVPASIPSRHTASRCGTSPGPARYASPPVDGSGG